MYTLAQLDAIGFTVDNTLTRTKSGEQYRHGADDWEWIPGRREHLARLVGMGKHVFIASNQGGVAWGLLGEEAITEAIRQMCAEVGIPSEHIHLCFMHPKAKLPQYRGVSIRRKPGPGMLSEAMSDAKVSPARTLFVGDMPDDVGAAQAAGCHFMHAAEFFGSPEMPLDETIQETLATCILRGEASLVMIGTRTFVRFSDQREPVALTDLHYDAEKGLTERQRLSGPTPPAEQVEDETPSASRLIVAPPW